MSKKIIALILCLIMCFGCLSVLSSCGGSGSGSGSKKDTFVIMVDSLDGLFNPFFSTSANDGTIVAMTQIGLLTSAYRNGTTVVAYGENEATVALDYMSKYDADKNETTYTFVIKNGVKFSDGHPLTIEDVLFNLYVYLDPVYSGSSTIYSTDIKGLTAYRTQTEGADSDNDTSDMTNELATQYAIARRNLLANLFMENGKTSADGSSFYYTDAQMRAAIDGAYIPEEYKLAVAPDRDWNTFDFNEQLLLDYERTLLLFRQELERDYNSASASFTESPYKEHPEFKDEVFCFLFMEGYIKPTYAKLEENGVLTDKDDTSKIIGFEDADIMDRITTKQQAIEYVYTDKTTSALHEILNYWATATDLLTEYTAKAKDVIIANSIKDDGSLLVPKIEGIKSLGHNTDRESVTIDDRTYQIAHQHNADGTPAVEGTYDVLEITINGIDPKAQWNFAFTVAPQHYYGNSEKYPVDIAADKFGVAFGSYDFMADVVQSTRNVKLPMGAGAYKVTNRANSDNPGQNEFYTNNIAYFKANNYFETVGSGLNNAKIGKVRYQIVSENNAISALKSGAVDYITPQLTAENLTAIESIKNAKSIQVRQLGYGYIGINAEKVPNLYIRRAIMAAMNTALAVSYYRSGTAEQIFWPMSKVSWAYPYDENEPEVELTRPEGVTYPHFGIFDEASVRAEIEGYIQQARELETITEKDLTIEFTIAGSNLQDHPTYAVFRDAAALLNSMEGMNWKVTVTPDVNALTKINSGALQVWAAAWGSTIDPDMYQVYHKNSTAGSTNAWGYPHLKISGTTEEKNLLNELSEYIDYARETDDQDVRADLYKQAMSKVLQLAVELPVYQRSTIYVYNSKVIDSDSFPALINEYSSPLDRIWELEFA